MAAYTSTKAGPPLSGRFVNGDTLTDSNGDVYEYRKSYRAAQGGWISTPRTARPVTSVGVGTVGGATIVATEYGVGDMHQTSLALTATPISVTDEAGISQWGGVKIYTFPAGLINLLGAQMSVNLTLGVTGTIINTFASINSLGTVVASATGAATLVTTAATWLQQTASAAAVAKVAAIDSVSAATQLTESGGRHVDGTATAAEMWLNVKVTDDATHTSGTGTITGTVTFSWVNIGDN